ncbi:gluconate 2-dehydrogenase subunit 3 family protein [Aquisalinus flavus]|uniref:Transcriptional initiation protein Tat n=1 Tax=Aquisalinus flavus TaxID=1526572 RepID=A0A8J2V5L2_9PROT|nr:gluconate 2-dehydrogenase subunit 3 family protein [Aquisalinus flavus]MBD0425778.1 gluconate 2-dehydrogenase subunit 3 family protein [Aquisalinus flavus]UNE48615.1 gluconate 2-dehydrogenase subunit 3 family protein [Aquisalinus flavus]GGD13378.1 transcriptional initiation protein Tat [Aquisalinus flavus]
MSYTSRISRRTTLKWLAATMGVSATTACGPERTTPQEDYAERMAKRKTLAPARPVSGTTYGYDPHLVEPALTWEKSMSQDQLDVAARLSDLILPADDRSPAASDVGVPDFIDEWISAPYDNQQYDRERFLALFDWLEQEAQEQFDTGFAEASVDQQKQVLDRIAWYGRVEDGLDTMAAAFRSFRDIAIGAFFASEAGVQDIGYLGNKPVIGPYPGPTPEAIEHLERVLTSLGLAMPEAKYLP